MRTVEFGHMSDWQLSEHTVSASFRELLASELPGLGANQRYWMFLEYLIFSQFRDEATGGICIPASLVKQIGQVRAAKHFLDAFSANVVGLVYTEDEWSYENGVCRIVTHIEWPAAVVRALEHVDWRGNAGSRVWMRTGTQVTPKSQSLLRKQLAQEAEIAQQNAMPCQQVLLEYLNKLSSNRLTAMTRHNRYAAHAEADGIEDPIERTRVHRMIETICDQAKPYYRPSARGNTNRIFGMGHSLLGVPSPIRRALLREGFEMDLKSSQLAIYTRCWKVEDVLEFLHAGGDIWEELDNHFDGCVPKHILKICLYSMLNGASKETIKKDFGHMAQGSFGKHFFEHPLIASLWRTRRRVYQEIAASRGAVDAFGNWVSLDWARNRKGRPYPNYGRVVSRVSDSYELKLLMPVYELAMDTREFVVALHQHDGLTIVVRDRRRVEPVLEQIIGVVQCRADALGIPTRLVLSSS